MPLGVSLVGKEHVRNTDSVALGGAGFEWSQNAVLVLTSNSTPLVIVGNFAGGTQSWNSSVK
jgi:hypothetical protein